MHLGGGDKNQNNQFFRTIEHPSPLPERHARTCPLPERHACTGNSSGRLVWYSEANTSEYQDNLTEMCTVFLYMTTKTQYHLKIKKRDHSYSLFTQVINILLSFVSNI